MSEPIDSYYTWLGIPPQEQPADYYRLLGISRFEENREVISNAADQRMAHVRAFQNGPAASESQRVLNELSKAAGCLLNPRRKAMYDQHLRLSNNASKKIESRLPPAESPFPAIPFPAIKVQVARHPSETTAVKRRRPVLLQHRLGWWLAGAALLVVFGLIAAWQFSPTAPVAQQGALPVVPDSAPNATAAATVDSDPAASNSTASPKAAAQPAASGTPVTESSTASTRAAKSGPAIDPVPRDKSRDASRDERAQATTTPAPPNAASSSSEVPTAPDIPLGRPKGLRFRGNDRIELTNSIGLLDLRKPFTVELWVRFATEQGGHWMTGDMIIGPNHPEVPGNVVAGWQLFIQPTQNNRRRVAFSTGEGYAADFPVVANAWHHIAACSDAERITVFVDGRRSASGLLPRLQSSFVPSPIPIHIGSHDYLHANQPGGLEGDLRAFRISSTCRYTTSFEPAVLLAQDDDTQLLLDLAHSSGRHVEDVSGHGRDGTIIGAQWIELEAAAPSAVASAPIPLRPSPTTAKGTSSPSPPTVPTGLPNTQAVQPAPDDVALAKAREQVHKVLETEFKQAKEPKEQLALVDRLMTLAEESGDDLAGRYVMLEEAHQLALQAGSLAKSLSIIDDFAKRFSIDAPKLKATAVSRSAELTKTSADRRLLAETAIGLLDELMRAGAFDAAQEVAQAAVAAATRAKDADIGKVAREYRDEIAQARKQFNAAREAEKKIMATPDDQESQLRWGRFVCFQQRNWEAGLSHLALGSHQRLASAARQEQATPATAEQMVAMGKTWSELMKAVEPGERRAVALRALFWLRQAESQLKGLAQADVAKQMKELEADLPPRLRLLTAKPPKPSAGLAFRPPPEFIGMPGRIQVNGADVGVLWRYESGLRLTSANVLSVLAQAKIPRGKLHLELMGLLYLPESMTVNISQTGGSATGTAILAVDNKPLGEVGGMRATSDIYKLELNAGEHSVRWVLSGDDLGTSSLVFSNAATAQPLVLYHTPAMIALVRETPTRALLNVNMTRN